VVAPVAVLVADEPSPAVAIPKPEPAPARSRPVVPDPEPVARRGPIAPGEDLHEATEPGSAGPTVLLPPGWYGNPDVPGKPVQWWDGTKLTDRPH
jgi:hypothetical protein